MFPKYSFHFEFANSLFSSKTHSATLISLGFIPLFSINSTESGLITNLALPSAFLI